MGLTRAEWVAKIDGCLNGFEANLDAEAAGRVVQEIREEIAEMAEEEARLLNDNPPGADRYRWGSRCVASLASKIRRLP